MIEHKIEPRKLEVVEQLCGYVDELVDTKMLKPDTCWQPTDFLPDFQSETYLEELTELRSRAANIPNTVIVSLVGNMITEEALPSYQTWFNMLEGMNPERNVASEHAWTRWSRAWTAEENRHGDLLNKYLYLTGRADMKAVEQTIHRLIYNGVNNHTEADPYNGIIYTSFQERATKISHVNTGKLADKAGDDRLSRICKIIAGDEARHENAYKGMMKKIFELDPSGAMISFGKMMRRNIVMPAGLMGNQGKHNLFETFSAITQSIGIYTALDYAGIMKHLVDFWAVDKLSGLNSEANKMQDYLSSLPERYNKIAERVKKISSEPELIWL
jgi:acyl-[acyl-carrier-protein] desaturase